MDKERIIQDGFARENNQILTFKDDESFSQAVEVMVELAQPGNGHVSLESALLERGIRFELREASVSSTLV